MNRKYMHFLIDQYKVPSLFFLALYAGAVIISLTLGDDWTGAKGTLLLAAGISVAAAFAIPLGLFAFVHRRRSVDMYGAVPFTRMTQLMSNLIYGFGLSFGAFLVTWLALFVPAESGEVSAASMVSLLVMVMLICLTLVLFNSALFLIGNNMLDGIIILAGYSLMPAALNLTKNAFFEYMVPGGNSDTGFITLLSPVGMAVKTMMDFSPGGASVIDTRRIAALLCFCVVSILLLRSQFLRRDLERAEQLSGGKAAYPLLINAYALIILAAILMASGGAEISAILMEIFIVFVAYCIGQFIYRRAVRPNRALVAGFAICIAVAAGFTFAAWQTHGFGTGTKEQKPVTGTVTYQYSVSCNRSDLGELALEDDAGNAVFVTFEIKVPADGHDGKAARIVDNFRMEQAGNFYDSFFIGSDEMPENALLYMSKGDSKLGRTSYVDYGPVYEYIYQLRGRGLSESELWTISKSTDVTVVENSYNEEDSKTYTLEEYLKQR